MREEEKDASMRNLFEMNFKEDDQLSGWKTQQNFRSVSLNAQSQPNKFLNQSETEKLFGGGIPDAMDIIELKKSLTISPLNHSLKGPEELIRPTSMKNPRGFSMYA